MQDLAKYLIIISFCVLAPINPLVVYYLTDSRSEAIYAALIDFCAVVIILVSFCYLKRQSKFLSYGLLA